MDGKRGGSCPLYKTLCSIFLKDNAAHSSPKETCIVVLPCTSGLARSNPEPTWQAEGTGWEPALGKVAHRLRNTHVLGEGLVSSEHTPAAANSQRS